MLITLSRLYADGAHARQVVDELKAAGLPEDDIGIIASSRARSLVAENTGAAGLLAGLGAFILPGMGAVVAAGWLAGALGDAVMGGAAGGVIGALVSAGVGETEAMKFADGVKNGGTLVTIRVMAQDRDFFGDILDATIPVALRGYDPAVQLRGLGQAVKP